MPELEPEYRQIGDNLRRLRRDSDFSQDALASIVGMSRSALANIETAQQRVSVHQLLALASALRVEPAVLLPSSDYGPNQPLDQELVDKGVPEQTAQAVARLVGQFEGGAGDVSTK